MIKSQELPTKEDFEQWSKKFNLWDSRKALSEEEQFLRLFKGNASQGYYIATVLATIAGMTIFIMILISGDFEG